MHWEYWIPYLYLYHNGYKFISFLKNNWCFDNKNSSFHIIYPAPKIAFFFGCCLTIFNFYPIWHMLSSSISCIDRCIGVVEPVCWRHKNAKFWGLKAEGPLTRNRGPRKLYYTRYTHIRWSIALYALNGNVSLTEVKNEQRRHCWGGAYINLQESIIQSSLSFIHAFIHVGSWRCKRFGK